MSGPPPPSGPHDTSRGRKRHDQKLRKHITASVRGNIVTKEAPRLSDNPNSARAPAFSKQKPSEEASNSRRGAPHTKKTPKRFINSQSYLSEINTINDPAHPGYACNVSFADSFDNASFPSATHALAYAHAMFLDMGPLADAVFRADTAVEVERLSREDTAVEVERLSRAFPTETEARRNHAEGLLWETLQWKVTNVPAFTRRLQHSSGANFNLIATSNYWGTGPDGRGRNMYGRLLSQFRDLQLGIGTLGRLSQQPDSSDSSRECTPPPVRYRHNEGKFTGSQEPSTSSRQVPVDNVIIPPAPVVSKKTPPSKETAQPTKTTGDGQDGGTTPTEGNNTTATEATTGTTEDTPKQKQVASPSQDGLIYGDGKDPFNHNRDPSDITQYHSRYINDGLGQQHGHGATK